MTLNYWFPTEKYMSYYGHLFNRYGFRLFDTIFVLFLLVESNKFHLNFFHKIAVMNLYSIKSLSRLWYISAYYKNKQNQNQRLFVLKWKTIPVLKIKKFWNFQICLQTWIYFNEKYIKRPLNRKYTQKSLEI